FYPRLPLHKVGGNQLPPEDPMPNSHRLLFTLVCVFSWILLRPLAAHAQTVIATVGVGTGAFQVAVNPVTNKIYVVNRDSNSVTVIDGATNSNDTTTVTAGIAPIAIAVNPVTNKIYVANSGSSNVTVVDGT